MLVFSVWSVSVSTNLPVARKLNSNHHPGNNGAQYDWDWPWHQLRDGRPQRQLLHNGSATTDDKCPHYGSSTQGQILLSRADDALPELSLSSASIFVEDDVSMCTRGKRCAVCWLEEGQSYTDFVFSCSIYRKLCQVLCSVACSLLNSGSDWPWGTQSSDLPCVISWSNTFTFVSTIPCIFFVYKKHTKQCTVDTEVLKK